MKIDLTMDLAWGSCGKGGITGYLAQRTNYDTVVCAYGTQAGHSYNDAKSGIKMMVQQLPVGIICPTVKNVLIGPGALIHYDVIMREINEYGKFLEGKRLMIHEHAAIVTDEHSKIEYANGQTKMGSTAKGVGQAAIERIKRDVENPNVAKVRFKGTELEKYVVTRFEYMEALQQADSILVEGAQGFALSMYHGDYPYCTSRDVTPWQIAGDCGLPFEWAKFIHVYGVSRTYPIRVNNRDGSSGPAYPDQRELTWEELGKEPELTTVTKLPRRIFDFSKKQIEHASFHCIDYDFSTMVLTFADYCKSMEELLDVITKVQVTSGSKVGLVCFGPDDSDIIDLRNKPLGSAMHELRFRFEGVK